MKAVEFVLFILIAMCCTTCTSHIEFTYTHHIQLGFQDSSGNDLVKGLEYDWWRSDLYPDEPEFVIVNSDLYTLDIFFTKPCMDPGYHEDCLVFQEAKNKGNTLNLMQMPELAIRKYNGLQYLSITLMSMNTDGCGGVPRDIIFQLTCPHIFGDDKPREIITTWVSSDKVDAGELLCDYVEFDGERYKTDKSGTVSSYRSAIVGVKILNVK